MPYENEFDHYLRMQEKFNIKIGDKVFIFRKAFTHELGWQNSWPEVMDRAVGHYGIVTYSPGQYGIFVDVPEVTRLEGRPLQYPYFVIQIKR